ncbi:hypothetical protein [Sinorhizobium meliloti]|nr:hypothetical protein [Sinorhizobium meliloti]
MPRHHDEWLKTESLFGKIVVRWGQAMGLVYSLPEEMGFRNFAAIRLGLAQLNGDGTRLTHMRKLIEHEPKLFEDWKDRSGQAIKALQSLERLVPERDALIHGIPVSSSKMNPGTKETILEGAYLVQQHHWLDSERYVKVPEIATKHLEKIRSAYETMQRVALPMLFEDWETTFGFVPGRLDGDNS